MSVLLASAFTSVTGPIAQAAPAAGAGAADGGPVAGPPVIASSAGSPTVPSSPAPMGRIEGRLLERGTKKPLAGVNIFALPAKLKATTAADGTFAIENVPAGVVELIVNASGYIRLDIEDDVEAGKTLDEPLFLQRASYNGLEATVVGKVAKRDDTTKTMKQEQFLTMPGSGGDPVKAVQNMPGVARVQGFSSQVVIQGSAPQDTVYQIDDLEVPLVFHFGGLTSVISPEAIDSVDYLSAGYGPEYGRAMGGIVGLRTRNPATDRQKGFGFMDTTKAGFLLEGPIGSAKTSTGEARSSYLVAGRYSYLGAVLGAVLKDKSQFDLTVVPAFGDFTGIYKLKASDQDDFKLLTIYSHDELSFLFKEPIRTEPSLRGTFDNITNFYRVIPQWTHRFDDDHVGRFSLGLGQNQVRVDVGTDFFDLNESVLSQRAEYETKFAPAWRSYFGMDNEYSRSKVSLQLPNVSGGGGVSNPISSGQVASIDVTRDDLVLAPYWRNVFNAADSPWTWLPSVRVDYFNVTQEIRPQPRFALRYDVNESLKYKAATGVYYQAPQPQDTSGDLGNPDLKSPYAIHYTAGFEKDFREGSSRGWSLNSGLFYRNFQNLIVASSKTVIRSGVAVAEKYNNDGRGRSYGAEALLKYEAKPWTMWLAYTLSRSLRNEPGQDEHLFGYDQTHNVNLVASYETTKNWLLSGRARYVTGNPLTPIAGSTFDADNDVYVPARGAFTPSATMRSFSSTRGLTKNGSTIAGFSGLTSISKTLRTRKIPKGSATPTTTRKSKPSADFRSCRRSA